MMCITKASKSCWCSGKDKATAVKTQIDLSSTLNKSINESPLKYIGQKFVLGVAATRMEYSKAFASERT